MSGRTEAATEALRTINNLSASQHASVLKALDSAGLLDRPRAVHAASAVMPRETLTAIEVIAANEDNAVKVRRVISEAKRYNFEIRANERVDAFRLDEALRGHPDIEGRMRLKRNLHALGMLA
jgi:hypothetical protein